MKYLVIFVALLFCVTMVYCANDDPAAVNNDMAADDQSYALYEKDVNAENEAMAPESTAK